MAPTAGAEERGAAAAAKKSQRKNRKRRRKTAQRKKEAAQIKGRSTAAHSTWCESYGADQLDKVKANVPAEKLDERIAIPG